LFPFFLGARTNRAFKIERQMLTMNAKQTLTGNFRNTYGTKSSGLAEAIAHYGCVLKPSIQSIRGDLVTFSDGTAERIDEIVCCTGFENSFSFLDCNDDDPMLKRVGHEARISHNLYKHCVHPLTGSSLAFIGFVRPCFGAIPPLAEMQARWFALLCSNKIQLPDSTTMVDQIHTYVRYIEYLFTSYRTNRISNLTDFISFSDDMARAIGCRPSFGLKMLLTDPRLWIRCMLGPISNAQYRLCGPHKQTEEARRVLLTLKWNPMFYNVLELALLYISAFLWFCGVRKCKPHTWYPIHEWSI
jgi:dimethylaniline monooxygenase (N-oxide forming)